MLVYNGKELKGSVSDMYDVIVVGGGHAGIEASLAPSRMGLKTLLVTSNINNIGSMPCNTSNWWTCQRNHCKKKLMLLVDKCLKQQIRLTYK